LVTTWQGFKIVNQLTGLDRLLVPFFIKIFAKQNNIFNRFVLNPDLLLSDR